MMTSTVSMPTKKSWASIVKTGTEAELVSPTCSVVNMKQSPLQPAPRGAKAAACRGRVLVMLGHYGWILPLDDIDQRDAAKTGGRIYIHTRDVMGYQKLAEGDIVSFYLYIDDQGFGAEECRIESKVSTSVKAKAVTTMKPTAAEFVPGAANDFSHHGLYNMSSHVPDCQRVCEPAPFPMNPNATVFTPVGFSTVSGVAPTNNSNLLLINPAFLDDSDDEEEAVVQIGSDKSNMESALAAKDCSSDDDVDLPLHFGLPFKKRQNSESDDSTSAGAVSDLEDDCIHPPPGLNLPMGLSPPPGLSLPPDFRPPPGLC